MAERRYYWLKLKEDFFESKRIKKLRKLAGGDTLTIIYLKMQLKSIKTDGILTYTGLEKTFAEELALDLDENPDDVGLLLNYLAATGLIETSDNINFFLPWAVANTGSESMSAERVRNFRERERTKALQCNADVTEVKRIGNVEIDIDKERDIDVCLTKGVVPTLSEVEEFCLERHLSVEPYSFWRFFTERDWIVNGKPIENWKGVLISWERARRNNRDPGIEPDDFIKTVLRNVEADR